MLLRVQGGISLIIRIKLILNQKGQHPPIHIKKIKMFTEFYKKPTLNFGNALFY